MTIKEFPVRHTVSSTGPQCPYCGYEEQATDPNQFDVIGYHQDTCQGCGREFSVSVQKDVTWPCMPITEEPNDA